jgi:hypothetical protein
MSKMGGPSLSLVENNVSASSAAVGHYKGVMLCNRPFGGTVGMTVVADFIAFYRFLITAYSHSKIFSK